MFLKGHVFFWGGSSGIMKKTEDEVNIMKTMEDGLEIMNTTENVVVIM